MSIRSYYRWALLLPVVVPFLAVPLILLGETAGAIVVMLQYALMIGGIPYLLFATIFLLWTRGRSDRQLRMGVLLSPILFALLIAVCCLGFMAVDGFPWTGGGSLVMLLSAYALSISYGYVFLAELGRLLLRPEPGSPPASAHQHIQRSWPV